MLYQFREAQERLVPTKSEQQKKAQSASMAQQPKRSLKPKPPAKTVIPSTGITLAEEGITLAEDEALPEYTPPAKSATSTPGITLAEEGIELAEGEDQPAANKPRAKRETAGDGQGKHNDES